MWQGVIKTNLVSEDEDPDLVEEMTSEEEEEEEEERTSSGSQNRAPSRNSSLPRSRSLSRNSFTGSRNSWKSNGGGSGRRGEISLWLTFVFSKTLRDSGLAQVDRAVCRVHSELPVAQTVCLEFRSMQTSFFSLCFSSIAGSDGVEDLTLIKPRKSLSLPKNQEHGAEGAVLGRLDSATFAKRMSSHLVSGVAHTH